MRYVCLHGHFYQPPRENPWLDAIEVQDSAAPYHDWNARITAECYWPNAAARLLDGANRIRDVVNNYEWLSFNFGPTLTAWLARHEPALLTRVVEADRASRERHAGHGNAIAQAYGHAILPLAGERDKRTHVRWGVREFAHRFGRAPEGMWLPETAVDTPTLEVLAAHGIQFTILAPHQARRTRPVGATLWEDVDGEGPDPRRPYLCRLPSGKSIALFFYHAPLARGVAFERLLDSGEQLVTRLADAFAEDPAEPQLVHAATDGETYGHHHRFGEMALAYALDEVERRGLARVTNYGEYLALHPPRWEVEIDENTSWSCAHGVERWRANCGCRIGGQSGWTQHWRAPLRAALDWLRDEIDAVFEREAAALLRDPWAARDAYIEVLLDRTPERGEAFTAQYATRGLSPAEGIHAARLLEMQHQRLLMFTSCGWFFDEISGLESTQILRYAARALELTKEVGGPALEAQFVDRLRAAPSNIPGVGNGAQVYLKLVRPSRVDAQQVAANYAICETLEPGQSPPVTPAFVVRRTDHEADVYGTTALSVGRMAVTSRITGEAGVFAFAVLKLSNHDVHCVVSDALTAPAYGRVKAELLHTFARHSLSEVLRALDRHFGEAYYTARDLVLDARRQALARVSESVLERLEQTYRQLYTENRRLMGYLRELDVPLPPGFAPAAEFLLRRDFARAVAGIIHQQGSVEDLDDVVAEARKWQVSLATGTVAEQVQHAIEGRVAALADHPLWEGVSEALRLLDLAKRLALPLNLWRAQTLFAQVGGRQLRVLLSRRRDDPAVARQLAVLRQLGERLEFAAVDGVPLATWGQPHQVVVGQG